jgi:hypothetical protein
MLVALYIKPIIMKAQKDRHLDAPGEANRDKHINFLAEENGDTDPADETFVNDASNNDTDTSDVDNGFFTDDNNKLQTKEENENDKNVHPSAQQQKVSPSEPDNKTTLGDRISLNTNNDDILTRVKDDKNSAYTNEDDQAH